jgi:hypothetical protein
MRKIRNSCKASSVRKTPRRRPKRRWKTNAEMDLNVKVWTGINWLRISFRGGVMGHWNESFGSIEGEKLLEQMSDYESLKKGVYSTELV